MHILYISEGFPPETDARPTRAFQHSRQWTRQGHRVSVMTKTPNHPHGRAYAGYTNAWHQMETVEGIEVHRIWSVLLPPRQIAYQLAGTLSFAVSVVVQSYRIKQVDVVLATSPSPFSALAGWLVARIRKLPFIFEVRDLWPESITALHPKPMPWVTTPLKWMVGFLYRQADTIICIAEGQRELIVNTYRIPPEKIHIVPNGADIDLLRPTGRREANRNAWGWNSKFVVIYAGNHGLSNHVSLIPDIAEHMRNHPEFLFVMIGEGSRKAALVERKNQLGLDNLIFYDQQPREAIPALYEAADVCIIPLHTSLAAHARPVKLYEAMAAGLPVVLSGSGEAAALVREANAGIIIAPNDVHAAGNAITKLAEQPDTLAILARNGPPFIAARFSRQAMAASLLDIMKNLCRKEK